MPSDIVLKPVSLGDTIVISDTDDVKHQKVDWIEGIIPRDRSEDYLILTYTVTTKGCLTPPSSKINNYPN